MFAWRYLNSSAEEIGVSARFEDADAAEAWLSEAWQDLRGRGVEEVELIDQQLCEILYRMGLSESGA